jgi:hypothetical protein
VSRALQLLAEVVRLDEEAKRDPQCIPIRDALEGAREDRWTRLIQEARALLAAQPS